MCRENNDFAEFMVHLIHRKRVPLLYNTVLILCDEGDGLVAVSRLLRIVVRQKLSSCIGPVKQNCLA